MGYSSIGEIEKLAILLVDDDSFMQRVVEKTLLDIGFTDITKADNGQHALDILAHTKVDIVLSDIQMPVKNGLELLQSIRCGDAGVEKNLRVIALTSMTDIVTMGAAIALDVNAFLTKPFTPDSVKKAILQILPEDHSELRHANYYREVSTDLRAAEPASEMAVPVAEVVEEKSFYAVSWADLVPDMTLAKDVLCDDGMLLLSAGYVLNQRTIDRLSDLVIVTNAERYFIETPAD